MVVRRWMPLWRTGYDIAGAGPSSSDAHFRSFQERRKVRPGYQYVPKALRHGIKVQDDTNGGKQRSFRLAIGWRSFKHRIVGDQLFLSVRVAGVPRKHLWNCGSRFAWECPNVAAAALLVQGYLL